MPKSTVRFMEWYSRQRRPVKALVVLLGGGIGTGVAVALAPFVGALASGAGLGVAAGTLSGAAASSAGLAALGGGAVAAGGTGMAGGTALVGAFGGVIATALTLRANRKVSSDGSRTQRAKERADHESVKDGEIKFE